MKTVGSSIRLPISIAGLFLVVQGWSAAADTLVSGTIATNTTWTVAASPYVVTAAVFVSGTTTPVLTIQPGATVKFRPSTYIQVGASSPGQLIANGTPAAPILFTTDQATVTAGYYYGLSLSSSVQSQLAYLTIEGAGKNSTQAAGLKIFSGNHLIDHLILRTNAYSGLMVAGGSPTVTNSAITGTTVSDALGVDLYSSANLTISHTAITNNTGAPFAIRNGATLSGMTGMTYSGNGVNAIRYRTQTITTSETWGSFGLAYYPDSWINVAAASAPVLTLAPGLTVKFRASNYLNVGSGNPGSIVALGTSAQPILITTDQTTVTPGYWYGIYMPSTVASHFSYTTVEGAGQNTTQAGGIKVWGGSHTFDHITLRTNANSGLMVAGGSPTVTNSTISSSALNGIYLATPATATLQSVTLQGSGAYAISQDAKVTLGSVSGLIATGNVNNAIEIRGATVDAATTWKNAGLPYVVTGSDVLVQKSGAPVPILTIEAGVTVKFNAGRSLSVGQTYPGGLTAVGTPGQLITFTANSATPTAGFWGGIRFLANTAAGSQLSYATVSYGGTTNSYGGVTVTSSSPALSNVTLQTSADSGLRITGTAAPTISSSTISGNPVGIYTLSGATPSLTALTIVNNTGFAISQDCSQTLGAVSGLTLTGNGTNGVELRAGTVAANATWKSIDWPYVATGNVNVVGGAGPVLTIQAGVTVKFNSGVSFQVGYGSGETGGLQAPGTLSQPIVFTANTGTPTPGYWHGIQFLSTALSSSNLSYATVSYGGYASSTWGGVHVQGSSPTLQNVTVTNNAYAGITIKGGSPSISSSTIASNPVGIYTSSGATPSLTTLTIATNTGFAISQDCNQTFVVISGLTLTGNGTNGVELRTGFITVDTIWKNTGWPYVVTGTVRGASLLTIQAGVTVKFNQNVALWIGPSDLGGFQAVGTSVSPITFTANTASPTPGYWPGIQLNSLTTPAQISYATVSYGGVQGVAGGISVTGGSPTISNVTFVNNAYAGISVSGGLPTIVSSTFASNPAGIINQTPFSSPNLPVNALLNYWGSATGPSGIGPGTGQSVSAGVLYNPWLTAAPVAPEYFSSATASNLRFNPSSGQAAWSLAASQSSSWTLTVSNSGHTVVRTITGSGTTFNPTWNGRNDLGVLQPDGIYSYSLQASSLQGTASPAAGFLFVDSLLSVVLSSPVDGQTLSNVYSNGVTDVPVSGTVNMTGLSLWRLNYGVGSAPSTWTQVGFGTRGVTNGLLTYWATLSIPNQPYTLWLSAWDSAGYYSQITISVTVANFSASGNALQLSAPAGNTITYTSHVPFTLTETLTLKNAAGQVVRTLVNGAPRAASTYNDVWDGKSDSAGFLPDGPYFYFATLTDGTHTFTWDQTNQYYNDWSVEQVPSLQAWDPFNNRPLALTYNFYQASQVTIVVTSNQVCRYFTCIPANFCLAKDLYVESGPHTISWAGVDATGALRTDMCRLFVLARHDTFSKNAVVLFGTKPSVTNVTVAPAMYGPAVGTQTVSFDLTTFQNQAATVAVTFLNQTSLSVLRTITQTGQSPGHKTLTWDGHGDNGMWLADGPYTVSVSATDPLGNQVQGQILTVLQY